MTSKSRRCRPVFRLRNPEMLTGDSLAQDKPRRGGWGERGRGLLVTPHRAFLQRGREGAW
jgi:hypothetical protein